MGNRPVYSKDLMDSLSKTELDPRGSVECVVPFYAYRTSVTPSLSLKAKGIGSLMVHVTFQTLPNGSYAPYADGSEIVSGYQETDGELVFSFSMPVCRQAKFIFTEDGGLNPIEIETAGLCFI